MKGNSVLETVLGTLASLGLTKALSSRAEEPVLRGQPLVQGPQVVRGGTEWVKTQVSLFPLSCSVPHIPLLQRSGWSWDRAQRSQLALTPFSASLPTQWQQYSIAGKSVRSGQQPLWGKSQLYHLLAG